MRLSVIYSDEIIIRKIYCPFHFSSFSFLQTNRQGTCKTFKGCTWLLDDGTKKKFNPLVQLFSLFGQQMDMKPTSILSSWKNCQVIFLVFLVFGLCSTLPMLFRFLFLCYTHPSSLSCFRHSKGVSSTTTLLCLFSTSFWPLCHVIL